MKFYIAICPVQGGFNDVKGFFKSYLALPVVLFCWACGYAWKRKGWLKLDEIDIDSGRREMDWATFNAEIERRKNLSFFKRLYYRLF